MKVFTCLGPFDAKIKVEESVKYKEIEIDLPKELVEKWLPELKGYGIEVSVLGGAYCRRFIEGSYTRGWQSIYFSEFIKKHPKSPVLIDITQANRNGEHSEFYFGLAERLPCNPESKDCLVKDCKKELPWAFYVVSKDESVPDHVLGNKLSSVLAVLFGEITHVTYKPNEKEIRELERELLG